MSPENFERVQAAHAEALRLPPNEREVFVRSRFIGNPELQEELRQLVASYEECGDFLNTPFVERIIPSSAGLCPGRLGRYELLGKLGEGSSPVYLARKVDDIFEKRVAIKTLDRLSRSTEEFLRFRREIQIMALVEHPYIIRLIDWDVSGDSLAYIVTELIEGEHLDRFAARLALREKLQLFSKVCEGVAAAHRSLVVHRDLKPSNILVAPDGTPKLLDFGIAISLDDKSKLTETGMERMTVYYASPEQLRGERSITTASDVYSLGVLLYELIAGTAPYNFPRHELPSRVQTDSPLPLKSPSRELRAIVQKAMHKETGRRYESVDRLRDDVNRFLDGAPVSAHSDGAAYQLTKFAKRHWIALSASLIAAFLLAGLTIVSIAASRKAQRQSARITNLLSRVLSDVTVDRQRRVSLRVSRLVGETKVGYLTDLDQEYPNDPKIGRLLFDAWGALAVAQGYPATLNLGETTRAKENFERSAEVGETILARWGNDQELRQNLALVYIELGSVLLEMDRVAEARSKFDRAQSLVASASGQLDLRTRLEVLAQKSRILNLGGHQAEALEIRRQILDQRRDLFKKDPEGMKWEYPGTLCSYGELLREMGRFEESADAYAEALPMIEQLTQRRPTPLDTVWHLGRENEEYAKVLLALGRGQLARKHLVRAIDSYREVDREEPDAISNRRSLAMCLSLLGKVLADHGERQAARKLLAEALELSEQAARHDPGSVRAQREFGAIRENLVPLVR